MIDVKIIKKPKGQTKTVTSGINTMTGTGFFGGGSAGQADHSKTSDLASRALEADHAKTAHDLDDDSPTAEKFLSAISDDEAQGGITFLQGLKLGQGTNYGITETGIATLKEIAAELIKASTVTADQANLTTITATDTNTQNLTVTGAAHFFELIIDKARSAEGMVIQTAAHCTIDKVEAVTGGYRLYWRAEDTEGRAVTNDWLIGDQAYSQTCNLAEGQTFNASNRMWWRLVTATGTTTTDIGDISRKCHYIDVSDKDTEKYKGSSAPATGDAVTLLGSRTTASDAKLRQNASIYSSYNTIDTDLEPPLWAQYNGIKTFELKPYRTTWFAANGNHVTGDFSLSTGESLKGEKGDPGPQGETGPQGPTGPEGKKGDTGASGWGWAFTPNTLTLESDTAGNVKPNANSKAWLTVNYGGKAAQITDFAITQSSNCTTEAIRNQQGTMSGVQIMTVKTYSAKIGTETKTLPYASGFVTVKATAEASGNSITFTARVDFTVSVLAYAASLDVKADGITGRVDKLETENGTIKDNVSKLEQKSDSITATVAKTTVTGRNMIKGSMLRKVVRVNTANQNRKVNLTAGKAYTLSARGYVSQALKTAGLDMRVFVYTADGTGAWVDSAVIPFSETDGWTQKELTFTAKKTAEYSVCVQVCKGGVGYAAATETQVGFIDTIQLEEGEVATPWSPVADDFTSREIMDIEPWTTQAAYMTTVPVTLPDGTTGNVAHADMRAKTGVADILFKNDAFLPNRDETYTLTFYAKGTGQITSFLYAGDANPTCAGSVNDDKTTANNADGVSITDLTTDWRLHSVTFTTRADISAVKRHVIAARVPQGSEAWVCFPLMEKGGMTFGDTDDGKLATGVDIRRRRVTVTADKFTVQDNKGNKVFYTEDGNTYFTGDIFTKRGYFGGIIRKTKTVINAANWQEFLFPYDSANVVDGYYMPFDNLTPWIEFAEDLPLNTIDIVLPCIENGVVSNYDENTPADYVRSLVGNNIIIYNNSKVDVSLYNTVRYYQIYANQFDNMNPTDLVVNSIATGVASKSFAALQCVAFSGVSYVDRGGGTHIQYDVVLHGETVCWAYTGGIQKTKSAQGDVVSNDTDTHEP